MDASNANVLFGLEQDRSVKAVELELSQAQLRQTPQGWRALSKWVAHGGVVILHTDAAQLFGFETVAARPRTRDRAGQLFGRSRASLPFCTHPLLWGGTSQTLEGQTRGTLGVYLVYYQLQPGDQLALNHGAGVPLLSVTDLSAANAQKPLYAAMIAPYGAGWALMLPRAIEARADGATFARNLDSFVAALPPVNSTGATPANVSPEMWTSVAARAIETAYSQRKTSWGDLARAFSQALQPLPEAQLPSPQLPAVSAQPGTSVPSSIRELGDAASRGSDEKAQAPTPERLLMRRDEAELLARAFGRAETGDDQTARALLRQLNARLALQRGQAPGSQVPDVPRSDESFTALVALDGQGRKRLAPTSQPETEQREELVLQLQLWNGMLAATAANAFAADPPGRAAAWREALHWWNLALGQPLEPLEVNAGFNEDQTPPTPVVKLDTPPRWLGSVPLSLVRQWQQSARWEFQRAAHEPPVSLIWQGPHGEQNSMTMYPVDAAFPGLPTPVKGNEYPVSNSFRWRLARRTIGLLDGGVRDYMGWGADQVGMRLTPVPWQEVDYKWGGVDWFSLVSDTDMKLSGSHILLWSVPQIFAGERVGVPMKDRKGSYLKHTPADPQDVVYTWKTLDKKLQETREFNIRFKSTQEAGDVSLRRQREIYLAELATGLQLQELFSRTLPAYLTCAHRARLIETLAQGGTPIPQWLQEGLSNVARMSLAGNIQRKGIYPDLPSNQPTQPAVKIYATWQSSVIRAAASTNPRSSDLLWRNANTITGSPTKGIAGGQGDDLIIYGPLLIHQDSTRQVQFFYEQFGRGAVVETLQRLGSGQSIDEALQATTGLNQQQFFAAWRRWDADAPEMAAPSEGVSQDVPVQPAPPIAPQIAPDAPPVPQE